MRPQNEESPGGATPELSDITHIPAKGREFMLMKVSQSDQFIKVREYLKACDALGFLYRVNAFGQVCFDEGKDWSAFRIVWNKFEHPSAKVLKAVLASMGRVDKPFEAPKGPFITIDPMTGLVIGELEGAAV